MHNTSVYKFINFIMATSVELNLTEDTLRTGIDAIDSFGTPIAIPRGYYDYFILGMRGIEQYVNTNLNILHTVNNLETQDEVSQLVFTKDSCIVVIDGSENQLRIRKYDRTSNDFDENSLSLSQKNLTHVIVCSINDNKQIPGNLEAPVYMAQRNENGFGLITIPITVANNEVFPKIDALEVNDGRFSVALKRREKMIKALGFAKEAIKRMSGVLWYPLIVGQFNPLFERVLSDSFSGDTSRVHVESMYDRLRIKRVGDEIVLFWYCSDKVISSSPSCSDLYQMSLFRLDGTFVDKTFPKHEESGSEITCLTYRVFTPVDYRYEVRLSVEDGSEKDDSVEKVSLELIKYIFEGLLYRK